MKDERPRRRPTTLSGAATSLVSAARLQARKRRNGWDVAQDSLGSFVTSTREIGHGYVLRSRARLSQLEDWSLAEVNEAMNIWADSRHSQ